MYSSMLLQSAIRKHTSFARNVWNFFFFFMKIQQITLEISFLHDAVYNLCNCNWERKFIGAQNKDSKLYLNIFIILFISLLAAITECIFTAKPSTIQIMSDKSILISHHCRSFATRKAIRQEGIEWTYYHMYFILCICLFRSHIYIIFIFKVYICVKSKEGGNTK